MNLDCELYREKMCIYMLGKNGIEGFMKMMVQKMIVASASVPPPPPLKKTWKNMIKVGFEHCAAG